jgi:hypothetical protein
MRRGIAEGGTAMFEATLGSAQHHSNLTIFPILAEADRDLPYLLMADALATGVLTIKEVGHGQVPLLEAHNKALEPVLILDGEQLIGAMQNRMTNRSILLPPESVTRIPVSCMEQGRWHQGSDTFHAAPQHAPSKVRRKARETEARSAVLARMAIAEGRETSASIHDLPEAQGEVWSEVRALNMRMGSHSPTDALDSVYEHRRSELNRWLGAFPALQQQTGLLAFLGAVPLSLDALGSPALYGPVHERLLTGYVLDALDAQERTNGEVDRGAAEQFVMAAKSAQRTPSESVGLGAYHVLDGLALGGELVHDQTLVHLSAFPPMADSGEGNGGPRVDRSGPLARPSLRRRRF